MLQVDDYRKLQSIFQDKSTKRIAIIGGDILGTELTYSLNRRYGRIAMRNDSENDNINEIVEVYQIVPESNILSNILPKVLSDYLIEQMCQLGVKVITNCRIRTADLLFPTKNETKISLKLSNNDSATENELEFDHVIVAAGAEPNILLAQHSGFELDEFGF